MKGSREEPSDTLSHLTSRFLLPDTLQPASQNLCFVRAKHRANVDQVFQKDDGHVSWTQLLNAGMAGTHYAAWAVIKTAEGRELAQSLCVQL